MARRKPTKGDMSKVYTVVGLFGQEHYVPSREERSLLKCKQAWAEVPTRLAKRLIRGL